MQTTPQGGDNDWKQVSVELPVRYWIVALGAIDGFIQNHVAPMIEESRKMGLTNDQLPDEKKAIIVGALSSRAAIVSEWVKLGAMAPDSEKKFGAQLLKNMAEIGRIHLAKKQNGKP